MRSMVQRYIHPMIGKPRNLWPLAWIVSIWLGLCSCGEMRSLESSAKKEWTFVSIPDFLNKDTHYPHPGFEEGLTYFLEAVKAENPDFVLVAGDLVDGRWPSKLEPTKEGIEEKASVFYPAWKARMAAHRLKYYVAVGDHEIGDNPWPEAKAELVAVFEAQFRQHMQMPENGPSHMKGLAYYFIHNNSLFITVDVFERGMGKEGHIVAQVTGEQLRWLEEVLAQNKQVDHVIVMGHTPVLAPVNRLHSSGMMLEKADRSPLWQTLAAHGVDLYLCGEVHAVTCTEKNGVQQIAHGSLFGWNPTVNYLVGKVSGDKMVLELKEIDIIPNVVDRKSLSIEFSQAAKENGFRTIGSMTIDKSSREAVKKKTGCFSEKDRK